MSDRVFQFASDKLPGGSFARAVFDSQLMRMSDKGGASHLIGEGWSDVVAGELKLWTGKPIPVNRADVVGGSVEEVHRLDTLPGVASRASKIGLKNPDFLAFARGDPGQIVVAIDAKFSIETARDEQVSAEATSRLFEDDQILSSLLPSINGNHQFARGLFVSPDYNLTRAMFRQRMGHRRMTVSRGDVVLVDVDGAEMFENLGQTGIIQLLIDLDALPVPVWESLLAGQYYFRLSRAIHGFALDEQMPLLGQLEAPPGEGHVMEKLLRRSHGAHSAWELMLAWDRDAEHIRRQRQALHQVVGMPLTGAELRALADVVLADVEPDDRPSRNQVRKALGRAFTHDVLEQTGVVMPAVSDFTAELERVASISRGVAEQYLADIESIVREIIVAVIAERAGVDES